MENDYSYMTEYAKSNRSSCKSCKDGISKDVLRMAIMVQSPHFDGKIPQWYHFNCFFAKVKLTNVNELKHFDALRWEDQERIKNKTSSKGNVSTGSDLNISIEYAKSNRSKCGKCEEKIEKSVIRISLMVDENGKAESVKRWHHINCFNEMKAEIIQSTPNFDIELVTGFNNINEQDKSDLKTKFKSWKSRKRTQPRKESKLTSKKGKNENDLNDILKNQSQKLWNLKDKLNKEVSKKALIDLLELNEQYVPKGESNLLDSVSDCLLFGRLNSCPDCTGKLSYTNNKYKCRSMVNEWTKCLYEAREVTRSLFVVPEEYRNVEVLKNYTYIPTERFLSTELEISKPLQGYAIAIDRIKFNNGYNKIQLQNQIKILGGEVSKSLTSNTLLLISAKEAQEGNENSLICEALSLSIDVVSVNFLENLGADNLYDSIKKHSITDCGRSREEIHNLRKNMTKENISMNLKRNEIQRVTVKGGAAVDPDSKLQKKAHLYQDKKTQEPFNAILGSTDLVRGSNSYYKLQLLESDKKQKWWVFRSWGRIGTHIGSNKLESFDDVTDALESFKETYLDKTGNSWKNRKNFQKYPNKFSPIDVDYGEEVAKNLNTVELESKLDISVQTLIQFIFDLKRMKEMMLEFEIDMNRMPLGKLSKNQINISYNILKELQETLSSSDVTKTKLFELSNRFYTMMPHNFGLRVPPLLDSTDMVKEKCEMLESLMEMEVAYKLMNVEDGGNIIDKRYEKLQNRITPLQKNSEEYQRLETYMKNTHAPSHDEYSLTCLEIYSVERANEDKRFQSFEKLSNRMMLWHGSRQTNWAGILSQGLRIAPPEAPVTGYMFGKGIYFADMVSKSANYCHTNSENNLALLMLCEVALGTMTERYKADERIKLKQGEHSCKGVGATIPNPRDNFTDTDGIVYPLGKPVKQEVKTDLLYNEYIVYDIGQVRQRYLFKVQVKYRR